MAPDGSAEDGDGEHGPHRRLVAEGRFSGEDCQQVADQPPDGKNQDVDLRVPKPPEEMLIEQNLPTRMWGEWTGQEKRRAKTTVAEHHEEGRGNDGQPQCIEHGAVEEPPERQR